MSGFLKRFFGKGKFDLDENIERLKKRENSYIYIPFGLV